MEWGELFVDVERRPEPTKALQLQSEMRAAIRDGRLAAGDRLPASRTLAAELGWARNVVVSAFDQLIAEGFLVARVGDGTRVSDRVVAPEPQSQNVRPAERSGPPLEIDLEPGTPDLHAFPIREWRRSTSDALAAIPAGELAYGDGDGAPVLRQALARYLNRTRATQLHADQIVVTTGVSAALRLLAATLAARGRPPIIAVEDPGAYTQRDTLRAAGATVVTVPVDERGIVVDHLAPTGADVVVVTPAHQYPYGCVLSPERRRELVEWARGRAGRLIVEDDYDAEFRYDRQPVGAIHGIAPDVAAITSSVSKTIAPAMRIGWFGAPPQLAHSLSRQLELDCVTPDVVQQHALAAMIDRGRYDRVIRARRKTYRGRRAILCEALATAPGCEVAGASGGLHLTLLLPTGTDETAVAEALTEDGIWAPPLGRYRDSPGPPGLVVSFASITADHAERFTASLAAILRAT